MKTGNMYINPVSYVKCTDNIATKFSDDGVSPMSERICLDTVRRTTSGDYVKPPAKYWDSLL